jgi:hypothetical protein
MILFLNKLTKNYSTGTVDSKFNNEKQNLQYLNPNPIYAFKGTVQRGGSGWKWSHSIFIKWVGAEFFS